MKSRVVIREYEPADKNAVMDLIRLNIPMYFAVEEEAAFDMYLDRERELYYVLSAGSYSLITTLLFIYIHF